MYPGDVDVASSGDVVDGADLAGPAGLLRAQAAAGQLYVHRLALGQLPAAAIIYIYIYIYIYISAQRSGSNVQGKLGGYHCKKNDAALWRRGGGGERTSDTVPLPASSPSCSLQMEFREVVEEGALWMDGWMDGLRGR
jgi:hypothetical protein